jgi:membrane protein YdbS with pleckstrin-like domain
MPWPEDALSENETIVTSFRPHWKLLFIPFLWFLGVSIAVILVATNLGGTWTLFVHGALLVLFVIFVIKPLIDWYWTRYVLTTERLVTRTGLIAKSGVEIPLERITNVNFAQTVFERMLKAGDLLIESAGSAGQSKFSNIPRPDEFQTLLYKTRENRSMELSGPRAAAPPATAPAPPAVTTGSDPAESIRKIAELRDEGLISEAEYETKRRDLLEGM